MIVYRATNTVNNKVYVGATINGLGMRKAEHKCDAFSRGLRTRFHGALRKYGWGAFIWEVLQQCPTIPELERAEADWIRRLASRRRSIGYNITEGGSGLRGVSPSPETRAKIAVSTRGRVVSAETRAKLSAANKGKKPSPACIEAWRRVGYTEAQRAKQSAAMQGRYPSAEIRMKYSLAQLKRAPEMQWRKVPLAAYPEILTRAKAGESLRSIGQSFGVTAPAICHLRRRALTRQEQRT